MRLAHALRIPPERNVVYRSSSSVVLVAGTATLNKPTGVVDGDLLLYMDTVPTSGYSTVPPTGFTSLGTLTWFGGTYYGRFMYKIAASEPASWGIGANNTGDAHMIALIPSRPITGYQAGAMTEDVSAGNAASASVTASAAGVLVQLVCDRDTSFADPTPAAGMTLMKKVSPAIYFSGVVAAQSISAGATGVKTMTGVGASYGNQNMLVAFNM